MPNDEEKKLEKLARIAEEFEFDDLEEEMTGKTREERDKILEREGTSRAAFEAAHKRALAKVRERAKELKSARSETPEVKPASTQKPAAERSNVIDFRTYQTRVVRWAAGAGLGGMVLAAAICGIFIKAAGLEIPTNTNPTGTSTGTTTSPTGTGTGPESPLVEAKQLRMDAYALCFEQHFTECLEKLNAARNIDAVNDMSGAAQNARVYAEWHLTQRDR